MDQNKAGAWRQQTHGVETFEQWLTHQGPGQLDERGESELKERDRRFEVWQCSVCGHRLGEHLVDQSGEHTVFSCPVSPEGDLPRKAPMPLNEFGLPRTDVPPQ